MKETYDKLFVANKKHIDLYAQNKFILDIFDSIEGLYLRSNEKFQIESFSEKFSSFTKNFQTYVNLLLQISKDDLKNFNQKLSIYIPYTAIAFNIDSILSANYQEYHSKL